MNFKEYLKNRDREFYLEMDSGRRGFLSNLGKAALGATAITAAMGNKEARAESGKEVTCPKCNHTFVPSNNTQSEAEKIYELVKPPDINFNTFIGKDKIYRHQPDYGLHGKPNIIKYSIDELPFYKEKIPFSNLEQQLKNEFIYIVNNPEKYDDRNPSHTNPTSILSNLKKYNETKNEKYLKEITEKFLLPYLQLATALTQYYMSYKKFEMPVNTFLKNSSMLKYPDAQKIVSQIENWDYRKQKTNLRSNGQETLADDISRNEIMHNSHFIYEKIESMLYKR